MSLIVSITSPHERTGKTTFALHLAQAIGYTQNMSVLLISMSPSKTLSKYIGIEEEDDLTATIGQVVELIENDAITSEEIPDYCRKISVNCEFLDTTTEKFSSDEIDNLVQVVAEMSPSDVVVVECLDKPIHKTDAEIIVCNEDSDSLRRASNMLREDNKIKGNQFVLVQKFNPRINSLRTLAKKVGIPFRYIGKYHLCEVLEKEAEKQTLDTVVQYIVEKEPTVVDLNIDLKEVIGYVLGIQGIKAKWQG